MQFNPNLCYSPGAYRVSRLGGTSLELQNTRKECILRSLSAAKFYGNIYLQDTSAVQVIVGGMCGLLCVQIVSSASSLASNAIYLFKPCILIFHFCLVYWGFYATLLALYTDQSFFYKRNIFTYNIFSKGQSVHFQEINIWVSIPKEFDEKELIKLVCNQGILIYRSYTLSVHEQKTWFCL